MSFNAFECRLVACCERLSSVPHRPSCRLHYDFFARDRGVTAGRGRRAAPAERTPAAEAAAQRSETRAQILTTQQCMPRVLQPFTVIGVPTANYYLHQVSYCFFKYLYSDKEKVRQYLLRSSWIKKYTLYNKLFFRDFKKVPIAELFIKIRIIDYRTYLAVYIPSIKRSSGRTRKSAKQRRYKTFVEAQLLVTCLNPQ